MDAGAVSTGTGRTRLDKSRGTGSRSGAKSQNFQAKTEWNVPLIAGTIVVLLGVMGGGIYFAAKPDKTGKGVTPVPPPGPVMTEVVKPAAPEVLKFSIASEPQGAEVKIGGVERGVTPVEVEYPPGLLPLKLELTLKGYEAHSEYLTKDSKLEISAELKKTPKASGQPTVIRTTR